MANFLCHFSWLMLLLGACGTPVELGSADHLQQDDQLQAITLLQSKKGARMLRLDERRGAWVPVVHNQPLSPSSPDGPFFPSNLYGPWDVLVMSDTMAWLPIIGPGPQLLVHREDIEPVRFESYSKRSLGDPPQRTLRFKPYRAKTYTSPLFDYANDKRLAPVQTTESSTNVLLETQTYALVLGDNTNLGWVSRQELYERETAPMRDAYVLGAGRWPLYKDAAAFHFLLAREYRTVYLNDIGPYDDDIDNLEYAESDYVQQMYQRKCPSDAQGVHEVIRFCELVPEAPDNFNFDYMKTPAADIPGPIPNADFFVIYPIGSLLSELASQLAVLMGPGSRAYVVTEYPDRVTGPIKRREVDLSYVKESLHDSHFMTFGEGVEGNTQFAWKSVLFSSFLNHDGRLIYVVSDFDQYSHHSEQKLIRLFVAD